MEGPNSSSKTGKDSVAYPMEVKKNKRKKQKKKKG
jgi:hypothetical protein